MRDFLAVSSDPACHWSEFKNKNKNKNRSLLVIWIWTNVWCVRLARSRCMCLTFWFLGSAFYDKQWMQIIYLSWGHATLDCFCLHPRMKGIAMCLVHCGPFETMNKDKKEKKRKGDSILASNLWNVCDSSHDEAFDLEYSNVVANSPCWALSKRARVDQAGSERSQQLALATCYHGPSPSTISL